MKSTAEWVIRRGVPHVALELTLDDAISLSNTLEDAWGDLNTQAVEDVLRACLVHVTDPE